MKTIYKYNCPMNDTFEIPLPFNSRVLTIQAQGESICLWAIVDTEEKSIGKRKFYVCGTGFLLPEIISSLKHISTVQQNELVWHIFE